MIMDDYRGGVKNPYECDYVICELSLMNQHLKEMIFSDRCSPSHLQISTK